MIWSLVSIWCIVLVTHEQMNKSSDKTCQIQPVRGFKASSQFPSAKSNAMVGNGNNIHANLWLSNIIQILRYINWLTRIQLLETIPLANLPITHQIYGSHLLTRPDPQPICPLEYRSIAYLPTRDQNHEPDPVVLLDSCILIQIYFTNLVGEICRKSDSADCWTEQIAC